MFKKNGFQKLAGLWLVGEIVNHVGIYLDLRTPRVSRHSNVGLVIDFLYHNEAKTIVDIVSSLCLYWDELSGDTFLPYLYIFCSLRWSLPIISQTHTPCSLPITEDKQRVLMHGHQGWNVRHGLCHICMIYVYIWVVHSFCLFCCLFIIVTTQFVALYEPCKPKPKPKPSTYDTRTTTPGRDPNSDT